MKERKKAGGRALPPNSHKPPCCRQCDTQMGLSVGRRIAAWVCPLHGAQVWIVKDKLNGQYDVAKIGGSA